MKNFSQSQTIRCFEQTQLTRRINAFMFASKHVEHALAFHYQATRPNVFLYTCTALKGKALLQLKVSLSENQGALLMIENMEEFTSDELFYIWSLKSSLPELGICLLGDQTFRYKLESCLLDHLFPVSEMIDQWYMMVGLNVSADSQ